MGEFDFQQTGVPGRKRYRSGFARAAPASPGLVGSRDARARATGSS
jgi:hypothetical protein